MKYNFNHPNQIIRLPWGGQNGGVVLFEGALYEEAALYETLGVTLSPSPQKNKPKD